MVFKKNYNYDKIVLEGRLVKMIFIILLLVALIIGGLFLIFKIVKNGKLESNFSVKDIVKPSDDDSSDEEIEVLDVYNDESEKLSSNNDSLDLDDLFKTISMSAIENDEFDFGLRRSEKK